MSGKIAETSEFATHLGVLVGSSMLGAESPPSIVVKCIALRRGRCVPKVIGSSWAKTPGGGWRLRSSQKNNRA